MLCLVESIVFAIQSSALLWTKNPESKDDISYIPIATPQARVKNAKVNLKKKKKKHDSSKIVLGINNISTLIKSNLCLDPREQRKFRI